MNTQIKEDIIKTSSNIISELHLKVKTTKDYMYLKTYIISLSKQINYCTKICNQNNFTLRSIVLKYGFNFIFKPIFFFINFIYIYNSNPLYTRSFTFKFQYWTLFTIKPKIYYLL